eukprot:scaffold16.g40.t1
MAPYSSLQARASSSNGTSTSGVGVLTTARPHTPRGPPAPRCPTPNVRLAHRRVAAFTERVLELVIHSEPYPSCFLVSPDELSCRIDQGILPLVDLSKLSPHTLVPSLEAVEAYVASTLSVDQTVPSPLAYSPDFDAYLERCLELAEQASVGARPYVLLLQILSHLRLGRDPQLAASFSNYYTHFVVAFEDAIDLDPTCMGAADYVAAFRAWAVIDLPVLPIKGHEFGAHLKALLQRSAFSPQARARRGAGGEGRGEEPGGGAARRGREGARRGAGRGAAECAELLAALAAIKAQHPCYRICSYQLADLVFSLSYHADVLSDAQLLSVARAAAAFSYPTYQSLLPVLDAVCRQALAREAARPIAARRVLDAALVSAAAMRPRLGAELEARLPGWRAEAAAAEVAACAYT